MSQNKIELVDREIIANQLLLSLLDGDQVAVTFNLEDLSLVIEILSMFKKSDFDGWGWNNENPPLGKWQRVEDLKAGLVQLRKDAFNV